MKQFKEFQTDIDTLDVKNEKLLIRGKNLCDMLKEGDLTDAIGHTLLDKKFSKTEKQILNATLVSLHAGFEAYAPTILFPRISSSLGSSVSQSLAAGYCASGPYHTGAIEESMKQYRHITQQYETDLYKNTRQLVKQKTTEHEKLFGFGHPLFQKDPRPETLRKLAHDLNHQSPYLEIYDAIKDELYQQTSKHPNIDGICGALLSSLEFKPEHGVGLFLMSRTIGMLAHIVEENQRPAWSAWNGLVGKGLIERENGKL
jgi:citrate synthase